MWELEISHFRELHPKYGIYKPSGLLLDSTIAILDKYRQSPFTRTFSDKKIRVTVIGLPDFTRHPEATSPDANTCFCRIKFCKLGAGATTNFA